ncbi:MAG: family 20 glycosylhydrolase, partial [Clostridia bacterium]|nr:family 20 glycosylhydrolase [Clostridia bacterium]
CSGGNGDNTSVTTGSEPASDVTTETNIRINGTSEKLLGVKKYDVAATPGNKAFAISPSTRIMIDGESETEEVISAASVFISMFSEKHKESDKQIQLAIGSFTPAASDILLKLDENFKLSDNPSINDQGYTIDIGDTVTVRAKTATGLYYGMITLLQYSKASEGMDYGYIADYPDVEERCLHLDCARKYFSKDFIIGMIKDISYLKMNALEMHFSENEGLRIQCDTDPSIVSEEYLTKDEVKEIIKTAKQYHVEIIPSFDSPGHLKHMLEIHPEYRLVDTNGYVSEKTLDITNDEAVAYVRSLLAEYAELFAGCKYFNIGGDECFGWSDRQRMRFSSWRVLRNYAQDKWGDDATAHDAFIDYLNETAAFMESKGFRVRAWNDGLMRVNEETGVKTISDTIDVCYWSDTATLGAESVRSFIENGNSIINVNEQYLYYVLKPEYDQRSAREIFTEWDPGVFSSTAYQQKYDMPFDDTMNGKMKGAYYCIWCDYPDSQTMEQVKERSADKIAAMAVKSWNAKCDIGFTKFKNQLSAIS